MSEEAIKVLETSEKSVSLIIKPRRIDSRKGENGVVAIVGGSRLYHGAPYLSALAALRSGVDLVYLFVPKTISTAVRSLSPNLIVIPLPDDKLTIGCVNKLLKWLPKVDVVVLGPGAGRQNIQGMVRLASELTSKGIRMLIDADALKYEVIEKIRSHKGDSITPHTGEFKRIFGIDLPRSTELKTQIVKTMAEKIGVNILLKGQVDIISDGNQVAINRTGTSAMTVGGTGDVLSGLVAGFMAKGIDAFNAAFVGSYVNGIAGERATGRLGLHIMATDLLEDLPYVLKRFDKEE